VKASASSGKSTDSVALAAAGYLAGFPARVRKILIGQRAAIRAAAPGAVEVFSYGIPGFKLDGKPLAWYAGYKGHTSLYPWARRVQRAFAAELEGCGFSKGTIRSRSRSRRRRRS
jgi:uncharacterized protein YdhG (YjbR/CyaY superfamily)